MQNIKLYAILDKKNDIISNVFLSGDDVQAGSFMVKQIKAIYEDVPANMISIFKEQVQNTAVVKIGEVDVQTKKLNNDYNLVCDFETFDFSDFKKESVEDNGK